MTDNTNTPKDNPVTKSSEPTNKATEAVTDARSLFEMAIKAKAERKDRPAIKITTRPQSIRVTTRVKGWFRCHPAGVYEGLEIFYPKDEEGDIKPMFLMPDVAEQMWGDEGGAVRTMTGYLIVTRGGGCYLFLVPEADETGKLHEASEDKHEACLGAMEHWTRLDWEKGPGAYEIKHAEGISGEPKWPESLDAVSILEQAFGTRGVIRSLDDPVLRRYRGEE